MVVEEKIEKEQILKKKKQRRINQKGLFVD